MEAGSPSPLLRLRRLLGRVRRRFTLDTFDVFVRTVPAIAAFEAPSGYAFRFGTAADVERCAEHHTELDARERRAGIERLGFGHKLVLGLHGPEPGTVVFTMWVNPRCLNVPDLMKRALGPRQWFIYKAFTSPEHRGKKLYESGMRFVLSEMRRGDLEELVGYAHVKKAVSRKGLTALQFDTVGRALRIDLPLFQHTHLSSTLVARFPRAVPRSQGVLAEPRSAHS